MDRGHDGLQSLVVAPNVVLAYPRDGPVVRVVGADEELDVREAATSQHAPTKGSGAQEVPRPQGTHGAGASQLRKRRSGRSMVRPVQIRNGTAACHQRRYATSTRKSCPVDPPVDEKSQFRHTHPVPNSPVPDLAARNASGDSPRTCSRGTCPAQASSDVREHFPTTRTCPLSYSGVTSVPPHASGATSSSVSENVHWWPAGSSAVYCRSPYSKSVGSMRMWAPCVLACAQ
jgi:hypothetical protein